MSKNRTARNRRQSLDIGIKAVKVLRTVGEQEAFYFYEAIGKPTGEVARNLSDFLEKVKSVKSESLMFHLQRNDFQNWVKRTLGDSKLARELGKISSSNSDEIRNLIFETVDNRIKELRNSSNAIVIADNSAILLPPS
jgi:predicted lactoylglutathione lyase